MRSLLLVPLAVGLAYAAQEASPKRSATIGAGTIQAVGVCDVKPDTIACWDLDGVKSQELEDGFRNEISNNREIQFRFGKKNRILAFRRPQNMGFQYKTNPNTYLYGNWTQNGDPVTEFVRIPAEPSDKQVVVTAQTTIQGLKDEEIAFKEGTVGQIDGKKLEIGAMQKVVPSKTPPNSRNYYYNGQPRPGEGWSVVLGISTKDNESVIWAYTALDSSGQPIRYVDSKGQPITAMKALALEPNLNNGNYNSNGEIPVPKPKAAMAYFQAGGMGQAFRALTNIDPKAISALRIRASHVEVVELGPFLLDPK
jgi:hypothetical protein